MTALPPGASTSREELTPSPPMGGFELAFALPFDRCSVYDELLIHPRRGHPLGASPNVAFSVVRPGYDAHDEVSESTCVYSYDGTCMLAMQYIARRECDSGPWNRAPIV